MAFAEVDWLAICLRGLVYLGTVATAGSVLFRTTFPQASLGLLPTLRWQIFIGALLLLVCEPLRYVLFQLNIAGGDMALAFDPSMRLIGMQTPLGQAGLIRLICLIPLLIIGLRWPVLGAIFALAMIGSYLFEGHTVSNGERFVLAPLLFAHIIAVHWWIGALIPLLIAASSLPDNLLAELVQRFGEYALWSVGLLIASGGLLLALLTGWHFDPGSAYQQAFAIKLIAFVVILGIAAVNKLRFTPMLAGNPEQGRPSLKTSLKVETFVAFLILFATALATSFPPTDH
jgi:putative copper resistance protein D